MIYPKKSSDKPESQTYPKVLMNLFYTYRVYPHPLILIIPIILKSASVYKTFFYILSLIWEKEEYCSYKDNKSNCRPECAFNKNIVFPCYPFEFFWEAEQYRINIDYHKFKIGDKIIDIHVYNAI